MSDALINGLAGAGGGIIAQILTYPLQAVNTRQQTERKAKQSIAQASIVEKGLPEDDRHLRKSLGTYKELCKVLREEGWEGLFRGLTPSLIGTAASQGVYYYFYQLFKDEAQAIALRQKKNGASDGSTGMFTALIVAALAGGLNVLLTNPIWVLVTRMQTHAQAERNAGKGKDVAEDLLKAGAGSSLQKSFSKDKPYGTLTAIQDLYGEAGIKGFWKGVFPTLIMVSNPSMQFMLYEGMLKQLRRKREANAKGLTGVTALELPVAPALSPAPWASCPLTLEGFRALKQPQISKKQQPGCAEFAPV
ncbi:hypothetical protein L7F22_024226 [Adiantum nelumboides]|nr:hypothetical protein [Adiantum nelumboides]